MNFDKRWLCLGAFLVGVIFVPNANADLVTYTDEATWLAALAGAPTLEDFESATDDIDFAGTAGPIMFNELGFDSNGDFDDNGQIDVTPFTNFRGEINGDVVVDMNFLNFTGGNAPEYVEMMLPTGISAFSFVYRNGDSVGDFTTLTVDGVAVTAFDAQDLRYFAPAEGGTGPAFFGVINTSGTMSDVRFTAASSGNGGSTVFNSFDDVQYGVRSVPEPTSFAIIATLAGICGIRRRR